MYVGWEMLTFVVLIQNAGDPVQVAGHSDVESETVGLITVEG